MFEKYIDRLLLVAILIVGLIGVFGGSNSSGKLGATDYSKTSVTDSDAIITGTLTVNGASTLTGTSTLTGELQAQRIVNGGTITSASSSLVAAMSLTAAQVCNNSIISVNNAALTATSAAASLDITLPATTTLFADCLDTEGDSTSFIFVNASPTAASTTEMIAGAGCESFKSQDTGGADTVPGLGAAKITFLRATDYMGVNAANDCIMTVEPYIFD